MREPVFLTLDEVVELQEEQLDLYGGGEKGIINQNGLDSAVNAPLFNHAYGPWTQFSLASVLLRSLAQNHPFENGNKRVALVSALVALHLNGIVVLAGKKLALADLVLDLLAGKKSVEDVEYFLDGNHIRTMNHGPIQDDADRRRRFREARSWANLTYADDFRKLAE